MVSKHVKEALSFIVPCLPNSLIRGIHLVDLHPKKGPYNECNRKASGKRKFIMMTVCFKSQSNSLALINMIFMDSS